MVLWLKFAGVQALVLWQAPHGPGKWLAGISVAWQLAQSPTLVIMAWFILAGDQALVSWHMLQSLGRWKWFAGALVSFSEWQATQADGVPAKMPLAWQAVQSMVACLPASGKKACTAPGLPGGKANMRGSIGVAALPVGVVSEGVLPPA